MLLHAVLQLAGRSACMALPAALLWECSPC